MHDGGLSLAFIERRPLAAARVLNSLPVADAAVYLAQIPTRHAAKVLGKVSAWPASALLLAMPASAAAAILQALPYLDAAAILRLLRTADRQSLLESLPRKLRRDLSMTLSFPADTVGYRMVVDIVVFKAGQSVADAIDALGKAERRSVETLFLVDERRRYLGSIAVHELLRHPRESVLGELPQRKAQPLLARQSLASVRELSGWSEHTSLPVLGRRRHLIGALTVGQLLGDGLAMRARQGTVVPLLDAFTGIAAALLELLSTRSRPATQAPERST